MWAFFLDQLVRKPVDHRRKIERTRYPKLPKEELDGMILSAIADEPMSVGELRHELGLPSDSQLKSRLSIMKHQKPSRSQRLRRCDISQQEVRHENERIDRRCT